MNRHWAHIGAILSLLLSNWTSLIAELLSDIASRATKTRHLTPRQLVKFKKMKTSHFIYLFIYFKAPIFLCVLKLSGRQSGCWWRWYWCEKNGLSQWNHVSFYSCHHHHPAFPQWPLQAWCWSGLQAESFTRCCSDYCNICNINSRAGHQHSRHNSHDNEVTVSAQDRMTMMFLSQCVDYALYSVSHRARGCSG